jgi:hypothetical protein
MSVLGNENLKKLDFSAFLLNLVLIFFAQVKLPFSMRSFLLVVLPLILLCATQFYFIKTKRPGTVIWPAASSSALAVSYYFVIGIYFSSSADSEAITGNALLLLPIPVAYFVINVAGLFVTSKILKS